MNPESSRRFGFGFIAFFWALIAFTHFPAPFLDDAAYIGAAMNLAQHGVFSNPLCPWFATIGSADHFYCYMPLHSFVLAGWFKVAGIGTLSLHLLYTSIAFAIGLLIYRLLPATKHAWAFAVLSTFALYGVLDGVGLRPDSLGILFFLLGVDVFWSRSLGIFFLKNLFLALSVITFPNVGLPALIVSASALAYRLKVKKEPMPAVVRAASVAAAAYGVAFLVLLACIQGNLLEFLSSLAQGQKMSSLGVENRFRLSTAMGFAKWIAIQLPFLALILTLLVERWRQPRREPERFFLFVLLLAFAVLGFSSISSATGIHWWAFGCLVAGLFIIALESWNWRAWGVWCVVFMVGIFGHDHVAVEDCLAARPPGKEKLEALRSEIERLSPRRICVDTYALREIYDYRLPENALSFEMCSTTGWGQPGTPSMLPPDSVSIVSVKNAFPTKAETGTVGRPFEYFHHPIKQIYKNPYDLVILDNRS